MKHMTLRLVGMVWLGLAVACDNPNGLPELCSARGNPEGQAVVTCFTRFGDGSFDDIAAFTQSFAGTLGLLDRWQYGEALHFTDFNGDGRVDLCGARGTAPGQLEAACFLRRSNGNLSSQADFHHAFQGSTPWEGDWSHGEDLSFVQP